MMGWDACHISKLIQPTNTFTLNLSHMERIGSFLASISLI